MRVLGAVVVALSPSYWQRTLAGTVAVVAIVPGLAIGVLVLRRVFLGPRAAGRRWPEGAGFAGWARVPAEVVVDLTRAPSQEGRADRDVLDVLSALRLGLALVVIATVPLSAGLAVAHPPLGLYVLAVVLLADAGLAAVVARRSAHRAGRPDDEVSGAAGVGRGADGDAAGAAGARTVALAAVAVGLAAGVIHVQWGTAELWAISEAQAAASLFGVSTLGLPGVVVQLPAIVLAAVALHVAFVAHGSRARSGGARDVVDELGRAVLVVAGSAWLAVVALGGGAVPWTVADDGVRHVLGASLVLAKTTLVAIGFAVSGERWPTVSDQGATRLVAAAVAIVAASLAITAAAQRLL